MAEEKRTRGVVNLARVVQKSRERYAPKDASKDLAKDPRWMVFLNRIGQSKNSELAQQLKSAATAEEATDVLIKAYMSSSSLYPVQNIVNSDAKPGEMISDLAAIVSGKLSKSDLKSLEHSVVTDITSKLQKEHHESIDQKIKAGSYSDNIRRETRQGIFRGLKRTISTAVIFALLGTAAYVYFNVSFEGRREEAIRPVYEQVMSEAIAAENVVVPMSSLINLGVDYSPLTFLPYQELPSSAAVAERYLAVTEMPETGETPEITLELLNAKVDAFAAIVSEYPGSLEAYKSDYQVYILKSFNQSIYTQEEVIGKINDIVLSYPNAESLSAKRLVELTEDYYTIQLRKTGSEASARAETIDWINETINENSGSHISYKLSYILANIMSGNTEFVSPDDTGTISLLDEIASEADNEEVIALYLAGMRESPMAASLVHYSAAQLYLDGIDLNNPESYALLESPIDVAGYLEESIALAEEYGSADASWLPEAYYSLALVARNMGQFDYATETLNALIQKYSDSSPVVSGNAQSVIDNMDQARVEREQARQQEIENQFYTWYEQSKDDAGITDIKDEIISVLNTVGGWFGSGE
ncbi:TPA: hypothetical protein HA239_00690 [Candidatus Woesearchaeota archaeon]|nr:hypothetical protein QT06_C0001G0178 [archaeon GW2011_AR15]MBS3104019.1 hypothetical protein [Candidatus Woesearchaeota archaeon]HIH40914.1 hypothetical protein [Candidatus Woesearchaeota archaeon]